MKYAVYQPHFISVLYNTNRIPRASKDFNQENGFDKGIQDNFVKLLTKTVYASLKIFRFLKEVLSGQRINK